MTNLFEYNTTTAESKYAKFIIRRTSNETTAKQNEQTERLVQAEKYAQSPLWLSLVMYLTFAFAIIVAGSFLNALLEVGFETALHNSRILLPIAGVCLVIAAAIFIFKKIRLNKTVSSPAFHNITESYEKINARCYEELSVPETADEINVFMNVFKTTKSGKQKNAAVANYMAFDFKVFAENNCLCFADVECVVAVPLSQINGIYAINKRASFINWTKQEKTNSPKYKPYKIRQNNMYYIVKPYYSLRFTSSGEEYEIIIPPYELETIKKYVNAPVI